MEEIKTLMNNYDRAQRSSLQANALRKQIIPKLKAAEMTKAKFNFGDRNISYKTYNSYDDISQSNIRTLLAEKYPAINSETFITDLYNMRKKRTVETLKVTPLKQKIDQK